jgi:preprotein translocase subunit SecG
MRMRIVLFFLFLVCLLSEGKLAQETKREKTTGKKELSGETGEKRIVRRTTISLVVHSFIHELVN